MLDAIRAEAIKLRRHRATWLMVWIYPIGVLLIQLAQLIRDLLRAPGANAPVTAAVWIHQTVGVWSVPPSTPGRFLIAGFAALAFAGEYGWNTWKLVIPARQRWQLIAAKWVVIAGLLAVLTRSVLASVVICFAFLLLEQAIVPIGLFAAGYAPGPTATVLRMLPFFHMANLAAWEKGAGLVVPLGTTTLAASWEASFAAMLAWIAGLGSATVARFARQDQN